MLDTLDAAAVRRWCGGGLEALRAHQHEIDELNVYPVPDGDTGTNLVLTLTSAQQALDEPLTDDNPPPAAAEAPTGRALRRMARGALLGARGNSGVIVSQILRGMADSLATAAAVRGGELAGALRSASEAAYAAVARPVEGTVLTVVAAAAEGAGRIKSDDLLLVARAAARSAAEALARTPQQLPALARAGVVDAGGRGLCLLLDALVDALGPADLPPTLPAALRSAAPAPDTAQPAPTTTPGSAPDGDWSAHSTAPGSAPDIDRPAYTTTPGSAPDIDRPAPTITPGSAPDGDWSAGPAHPTTTPDAATGSAVGYEVQYLVDTGAAAIDVLRATLDRLGDSLVVVGSGDGTWNVHVHVPAEGIGPALEAGVVAGRPHRISVTPLESARPHGHAGHEHPGQGHGHIGQGLTGHGQAGPGLAGDGQAGQGPAGQGHGSGYVGRGEAPGVEVDGDRRGAVVVAAGDGLTALFEAEGVTVVDRNPSTAEMVAAIRATGAGSVVLLPNDANTHAVATAAAREAETAGVRVSVVPTRSPVQALAALAVRDPARAFADDVIAMAEAAGACRYGEVCTAQRDSLTVAGPCRAGELLGLVDGEVHVIGADLEEVSRRLLDRMLGGGGELATLVLGADAPAALEGTLRGHVTQAWPFVELSCYAGGQPRYHLLVGVE